MQKNPRHFARGSPQQSLAATPVLPRKVRAAFSTKSSFQITWVGLPSSSEAATSEKRRFKRACLSKYGANQQDLSGANCSSRLARLNWHICPPQICRLLDVKNTSETEVKLWIGMPKTTFKLHKRQFTRYKFEVPVKVDAPIIVPKSKPGGLLPVPLVCPLLWVCFPALALTLALIQDLASLFKDWQDVCEPWLDLGSW